jgi:catechol 2,3-dioxygenase-like lactoylglutathione lyase family enzyme
MPPAPELNGLCPLIEVFDMVESVRFYCDLLGFEIARQSPWEELPYKHFNWALLRRGDVELMLNTAYDAECRPAARDAARTAAHRDTRLYFGCPSVDDAYAILHERGLTVKPPSVSHGMKGVHFRDPDGYGITLHWPATTD